MITDTDETFIVLEGDRRIDFRDGAVHLSAGEMFVVPKGVEHKPYAEREVKLLLVEPRGVLNTGMKETSALPRMMFGFRGQVGPLLARRPACRRATLPRTNFAAMAASANETQRQAAQIANHVITRLRDT